VLREEVCLHSYLSPARCTGEGSTERPSQLYSWQTVPLFIEREAGWYSTANGNALGNTRVLEVEYMLITFVSEC